MYRLPIWSIPAKDSIGLFYRELQDIEVYVEDNGSEAFYTKLLSRAVDNKVRIKKIIPLNGRINVVSKCKSYQESFPALFVIDGDLELLCGEREEPRLRLFQHRLYCVENYLFCNFAGLQLLQNKSGKLLEEQAIELLAWNDFSTSIQSALLDLFKVYAVSKKLLPCEPTVSRSYHKMCVNISKKRGAVPCTSKIDATIEEIKNKIIAATSEVKFNKVYDDVLDAVDKLGSPLYAISGKDYLMKAFRDYLDYKGASFPLDDGFKFQLARYCDTSPLNELGEAIFKTANGDRYLQASCPSVINLTSHP